MRRCRAGQPRPWQEECLLLLLTGRLGIRPAPGGRCFAHAGPLARGLLPLSWASLRGAMALGMARAGPYRSGPSPTQAGTVVRASGMLPVPSGQGLGP